MDDASFAHQLSAWLDPAHLLRAGQRYESEREKALDRTLLIVGSKRLRSGDEGNYAELVGKFLRGFQTPRALLELMESLMGDHTFTAETWQWLAQLRLSGKMRVCSRGNVPEGFPPQTILLIEERDAVVDLMRAPVLALLDLVDNLAVDWRQYAESGGALYHQPNMPTPFYTYVDAQVGDAFLDLDDMPNPGSVVGPNLRYRAVTVFGQPAAGDAWHQAREMARSSAENTQEPSPIKPR